MLSLKVINLFAAPSVGKSTTAAGLFNLMKMRGHSVELVSEFAKDLTWSKNWMGLTNQLHILGEQDRRLRVLDGQVEWAITDSPLPMGLAYCGDEWGGIDGWLADASWSAFERYHNYNILLNRSADIPYQEAGRNQTAEEAMKLDNVIDYLYGEAIEDSEDSIELHVNTQVAYRAYDWLIRGK